MEFIRVLRSRIPVRAIQLLLETYVLAGAFAFAYLLRFDFSIPPLSAREMFFQMLYVVPLQVISLRSFGTHRFIWRYTGPRDAKTIGAALGVVLLPVLAGRIFFTALPDALVVPYSITILDFVLGFLGILGVRMLRREVYERSNRSIRNKTDKKPVILVGAGQAGVMMLAEINRRVDIDFEVKAFVDDDKAKHGAIINGVKVLGGTNKIPELVKELAIDHVIISIAQASRQEFKKILGICRSIPIKVRTIPGLYELLQGNVTVSRIRDIEVEDLLGRSPVKLEQESMNAFLNSRTVMVTGAGGSIGSELVRQLADHNIEKLILIERSEFALFQIEREITERFPDVPIVPMIADICDRGRMDRIFAKYRPDVVFHAAAHKHVPLMERNASEALRNNTVGTSIVAELSGQYSADAFVLISTDKAVFPSSVMGATKRLAELVVQDLDKRYDTRFMAVRFGNVIGSNGSVIPTFREQIKRGGPVTVTHPEMTRYFMTIPEASQLVLQAGAIGKGGQIMILDMGEPVKILDLARDTIRLSGLRPDVDIQIKFVGIRPGEKMHEVLQSDAESLRKTSHPKIFIGQIAAMPSARMRDILDSIPQLCNNEYPDEVRKFLNASLPDARLKSDSIPKGRRIQPVDMPFKTHLPEAATANA